MSLWEKYYGITSYTKCLSEIENVINLCWCQSPQLCGSPPPNNAILPFGLSMCLSPLLTKSLALCLRILYSRNVESHPYCWAHNRPQFSSIQLLSHVWPFATPWIAARQASLSITNSRSSPKPRSIESVMPSNHLILCRPFLLLPAIPPSIRVFSNESNLEPVCRSTFGSNCCFLTYIWISQ